MGTFNPPKASANEIPIGLERTHLFNRPSTVDIPIVGSGAYVAGEIVAGLQMVFDATIARNYDGLTIRDINFTDEDNQKAPFVMHIFNQQPTGADFNDGDDFLTTVLAADLKKRRRSLIINAGSWLEASSLAYLDMFDINLSLDTRPGAKGPFYFVLVAAGAYTATNGLTAGFTSWIG